MIILITGAFVFTSCTDHSKNELEVLRASEEGFKRCNSTISLANEVLYRALEERLMDPKNRERAKIWQPRAIAIKTLSDHIIKYTEGLKNELIHEAGMNSGGNEKSFKYDNVNAVNRLFDTKDRGKELFGKLQQYRNDVLAVDSEIERTFRENISVGAVLSQPDSKTFTNQFFHNIPPVAALLMLSKIGSDVKITENNCVNFCFNKIPLLGGCRFMNRFGFILSQSSTIVKPGEVIEITSGIGSFSNAPNPIMTINGKSIYINDEGVAVYKLKASASPGKHSLPVRINFIKPDGTRESVTKNIGYTVADTAAKKN